MNNEEKERILYPLPFIEIVARKENTKRRKSNVQPKGEKGRINVHLQFKRAGKLTNKGKELPCQRNIKTQNSRSRFLSKRYCCSESTFENCSEISILCEFYQKKMLRSAGEYDYILLLPLMLEPK